MTEEKQDSHFTGKNWLQRIQEQSWEPEILISGIVLFALIQIPPFIDDFYRFLGTYSFRIFSSGTVDRTLIAILKTANYWLIVGFTAHLIFRSVWIAFVGLSYVYKDGVNIERLRYRPAYRKILRKNPDYKARIMGLEKLCSTTFAISFLLFMCVLGAFFFLTIIAIILGIAFKLGPDQFKTLEPYIDPVLSIFTLVYLFDFVSLGLLKRIPVISRIYYPLYRVMSTLTLAPLYRNIYYGLVSNHKKWKVGLWMLGFVVITFLMLRSFSFNNQLLNVMELKLDDSDELMAFHGHYENLMGDDPSQRIQISSDIIESQVVKVFIVHTTAFENEAFYNLCDYKQSKGKDRSDFYQDSLKMSCLEQFYGLSIDGQRWQPEYLYHEKQSTGQVGLLTYIDISHLSRGPHVIELHYNLENRKENAFATVEFYKSLPADQAEVNSEQESKSEEP